MYEHIQYLILADNQLEVVHVHLMKFLLLVYIGVLLKKIRQGWEERWVLS